MKITSSIVAFVSLLAALPLSIGCGLSSAEAKGAGKVTYKGAPITGGEVNLLSKEKGTGAAIKIDSAGMFNLPAGLVPGQYAVYVTPPIPSPPPPGTPFVPVASPIPLKARDPGTSGVMIALKGGANNLTVELTD